jgi:hypothetical protein
MEHLNPVIPVILFFITTLPALYLALRKLDGALMIIAFAVVTAGFIGLTFVTKELWIIASVAIVWLISFFAMFFLVKPKE